MDPVLRIERVSKHFGTRVALDGVSLDLDRSRVVAICGEAGAGKTTLARVLAGLERPTSGRVTVDGRDVAAVLQTRRGRAAFRRAVQFVPATGFFDPRRTVRDGLRLTLRVVARVSGRMADERIDRTLGALGLAPALADLLPAELTGEQHHVATLARALLPEPRLLICDEVDPAAPLIPYAKKCGLQVILCARALSSALPVDRLIVLDRGRVAVPAPDRVAA